MKQGGNTQTQSKDPFESTRSTPSALRDGWLLGQETEEAPRAKAAGSLKRLAQDLRLRLRQTPETSAQRDTETRHPLLGTRLLTGLAPRELEYLTTLFMASTPQAEWGSRQAALSHIESLLPVWGIRDWRNLLGMHVIVGSSGSGKSTLATKMAHAAQIAGRKVALLSLFPNQASANAAFKAVAAQLDLSGAVIETEDAWERALGTFENCDTIIVDTPCLLSDPGTARRLQRLPELRDPNTVIHHNVCLHHEPGFMAREAASVAHLAVDQIAISKADLAPGPGPLLALQMHRRRSISTLNDSPYLEEALESVSTSRLLESLLRSDN